MKEGADKALSLNGQQFMTRALKVQHSDPTRSSKSKPFVPVSLPLSNLAHQIQRKSNFTEPQ